MSIIRAIGNTVNNFCGELVLLLRSEGWKLVLCLRTLWTVFALTATFDLFLSLNILLLLTSCSYNMDTKVYALGNQRRVFLRCVVQCTTFCECVQLLLEICSTLRILTQNLRCSLKLVLRRLRMFCALYQVSWTTTNSGILFSWYWCKTLVLCTSIIEPSLTVVNVTCTVPSFVQWHYCCLKPLVLTILVQTLLLCILWSLNLSYWGFVYHVHCTKFCEVLLSLDIFSSKYWYRTLSARDHWTQSCWG